MHTFSGWHMRCDPQVSDHGERAGDALHSPVCADIPVKRSKDDADEHGRDETDEVVVGGAPVVDHVLGK